LIQETAVNLSQIIEALPLQVYLRHGELVIHFSSPSDLINRLAETSAALAELNIARTDGKSDRVGRRGPGRPAALNGGRYESEPGGSDPDPPASAG
jgi:hypothetical protein